MQDFLSDFFGDSRTDLCPLLGAWAADETVCPFYRNERFIKFLNGRVVVFIMRRVLKKSGHLGKTNRDAVIRVYDEAGNVIETREHTGDFKEW